MSTVQVHLPESVLADARTLTESSRVPLDDFLSRAVADQIESLKGHAYLRDRGRRGSRERFLAVLDSAPNVPPVPGDELPDAAP